MNRELKNGFYHAAWAIITLAPAAFFPPTYGFTASCFLAGLIREVTEEGDPVSVEKFVDALESWRDLFGWALGGLVLGVVVTVAA